MESVTQVVRGGSKIFVGEEGWNLFGETMEDQRKVKTFLAGEGANVCRFGREERVGVQASLIIVDGGHED